MPDVTVGSTQVSRSAGRRPHKQDRLLALALHMSSSLEPHIVMRTILSEGARLAAADRATLSSWKDGQLTIEASVGHEGDGWVGRHYDMSWIDRQPLVRKALTTRTVVTGGGLDAERAAPEFRDSLANVRHTATVPILEAGEVTGLLVLSRHQDPAFREQDRASLSMLGAIAGLALRNAKVHQQTAETVHHLDAAQRTRSNLLDIAVHELRSPLTVIQGYASLLAAGDLGQLGPPALKAVRVITAKASEAQEIATSLLTVARLESNELLIDRTAIALPAFLAAARDRLAPRLELAGASLSLDPPPPELVALADGDLVSRIIDNLVNNSLIYSDPPARVTVRARGGRGAVEIRVSDRGPGVPPGDRERIFERFVRGAGAERAAGTGLGLYVSRECARRMGGELTLESSSPGAGSTFLLRLPASGPPVATTAAPGDR